MGTYRVAIPVTCEICEKTFPNQMLFMEHSRLHRQGLIPGSKQEHLRNGSETTQKPQEDSHMPEENKSHTCTSIGCAEERITLKLEKKALEEKMTAAQKDAEELAKRKAHPADFVSVPDFIRHCTDGSCKGHSDQWQSYIDAEIAKASKLAPPSDVRTFEVVG